MRRLPSVLALGALLMAAAPLYAQGEGWQNMWFWGAQVGASMYQTPVSNGTQIAIDVGGHWLITGKKMGLYLAYDQLLYPNGPSYPAQSRITDPTSGTGTRDVAFDMGRYLQGDLLAMPLKGPLQVYLGAGFVIHQITDAAPLGTFATPEDQAYSQQLVDDAASKAFFNLMGGFQFLFGSRLAFYGHYEFIPSTKNFLLTSEQHVFAAGIRYALSGRREEVSTGR